MRKHRVPSGKHWPAHYLIRGGGPWARVGCYKPSTGNVVVKLHPTRADAQWDAATECGGNCEMDHQVQRSCPCPDCTPRRS